MKPVASGPFSTTRRLGAGTVAQGRLIRSSGACRMSRSQPPVRSTTRSGR